jgi:hypothetical protein
MIEGSSEDIESLINKIQHKSTKSSKTTNEIGTSRAGISIKDYVLQLRDAGFFKKPQGLADIRHGLETEGHIVPVTTLSGVMIGLARRRELRRFKEGMTWRYVVR